MKIGFVVDDTMDKPDGVQQYVLTLSTWLQSQGHEVHYLVGESHRQDLVNMHSLSKNIAVRFNKNRLSIPLPARKSKIRQLLSKEKFDILHVQMPHNPFLAARIVRLAPLTTAIVGTFHIAPYSRLETAATRALGIWLKRNLKYFDEIISVSKPAHDFAQKTFRVNSQILPNVINLVDFRSTSTANMPLTITFLGRLVPRKGCHHLLLALAILEDQLDETTPYILQICGDGQEREHLQKLRNKLKNPDRVKFVGFVKEDEKKQYLANSDIAIFPSTGGESFGIVLLEAMASGAGVVIAGNNPGYQSVLGSISECLIDPGDHKAFANKLAVFLTSRKLINDVHDQQQALVKQYDVETVGPKIIGIYNEAIAKRAKSTHN